MNLARVRHGAWVALIYGVVPAVIGFCGATAVTNRVLG